jgi:DNA-binding beta-propeller fold protein YncE
LSVALTPDEKLALITACMKPDPAHPGKQTEDNRMSVIDLTASPPRVIATLITGKGPSGVSINRQGTLALVTNRGDGSVSIFTIANQTVAPAGQIQIGNATSELAHVAFTVDGQHALVTRDGDNMITLLNVAGANVTLAGRDLRTGLKPYGIDVTPDGAAAVTTNTGFASGDVDTISVIDLHANPPRVVDVIPVGLTPEGVKISPDGKLCAITLQNGSNKPTSSPFYHDFGQLVLFRVDGTKLTRVADAPVGHWPQGIAFSADGKTILVCNMVEKNLSVFSWDGTTLRDTGVPIPLSGGAAAIRTAEK